MSSELISAYKKLNELGHAYSIETYEKDQLIGGMYGILTGKIFSGESMYQKRQDAAKAAVYALICFCRKTKIQIIDIQITNTNLNDLGMQIISRNEYEQILKKHNQEEINKDLIEKYQNSIDLKFT